MIVWAFWRGNTASVLLGDLTMHDIPRSVVEELHWACYVLWRAGKATSDLRGYGWAYKLWGQKHGQENG